ncbi:hypothetical protein OV320_2643 [Actinobacteria bacterium OV320]|jgi:hypothetical protein|nr:hypothetical protein OV320_2643 [Actinobacteria bacterium OV320]
MNDVPGWLVLEALVAAHVAVIGLLALTIHVTRAGIRRIRTRKEA